MKMYGFSATQYGWWFAIIAVGMGCGGQMGRVLLKRMTPHRLLVAGVAFAAVFGGIVLLMTRLFGLPPFWLFFAPLMLSLATCPIITANSQAIAMSESGENAGCASSLVGVAAFGIGGIVIALTGLLHNGTALPMVAMIFLCCVAGLAVLVFGKTLRDGRHGN